MSKRGRPSGITASEDTLAVVYLLHKLGWSNRQIGEIFRRNHETIRDWLSVACDSIADNCSAILVKGEGALRMKPSGNSADIEYLFGRIHQNPCGGGRQAKSHKYSSDWEDVQER